MEKKEKKPASVSASAMRRIDRFAIETLGIPGIVLMENAGRGVKEEAIKIIRNKKNPSVIIFCGGGNNGGDGFAAARHLANSGVRAGIILAKPAHAFKGDALTNLKILQKTGIPISN